MNNLKVLLNIFLLAGLSSIGYIQPNLQKVNQEVTDEPSTQPNLQKSNLTRLKTTDEVIWRGKSGSLSLKWTTVDLYLKQPSQVDKVFSPFVLKGGEDFAASQEDYPKCEYERYLTILSVVGTLVSFSDHCSFYCGGAHPTLDTRFTTIDLAKTGEVAYAKGENASGMDIDLANPGKVVKLTDYFPEDEILSALLEDKIVKKALEALDHPGRPKTLAGLPQLFADNEYELGDSGFALHPDFLTRFVFHHIEGNKVAVRIGLPPQVEALHAVHLQLGLLLPIPSKLRKSLSLADLNKEGFLMKDAKKIAGDKSTAFIYKIRQ